MDNSFLFQIFILGPIFLGAALSGNLERVVFLETEVGWVYFADPGPKLDAGWWEVGFYSFLMCPGRGLNPAKVGKQ